MKSGEEILDFSARHELRGSVVNICFLSGGALCEPSSQDVRSPEIKEVVHPAVLIGCEQFRRTTYWLEGLIKNRAVPLTCLKK